MQLLVDRDLEAGEGTTRASPGLGDDLGGDRHGRLLRRPRAEVIRTAGEHFTRRQLSLVQAAGFQIEEAERLKAGTVERIRARKPVPPETGA